MTPESIHPRPRVEGVPIGCPVVHHEGNCPFCGGGWPGTRAQGQAIVAAALKGRLLAENMACGTLRDQVDFLNSLFENPDPEPEV